MVSYAPKFLSTVSVTGNADASTIFENAQNNSMSFVYHSFPNVSEHALAALRLIHSDGVGC